VGCTAATDSVAAVGEVLPELATAKGSSNQTFGQTSSGIPEIVGGDVVGDDVAESSAGGLSSVEALLEVVWAFAVSAGSLAGVSVVGVLPEHPQFVNRATNATAMRAQFTTDCWSDFVKNLFLLLMRRPPASSNRVQGPTRFQMHRVSN